MKKSTLLLTTALIAINITSAISQTTGIPPQKPVVFATDTGETATTRGKVTVGIEGVYEAGAISAFVVIKDDTMMGGTFRIPPDAIGPFSAAIQEASDAVLSQSAYNKVLPGTATIGTSTDTQAVRVQFERKGFNLSTSSIDVDADNAATLARLIQRAQKNIEWLLPRLSKLTEK